MSNPDEGNQPQPQPRPAPAPVSDVETGQSPAPAPEESFGVGSVIRRWRREDLMRKASLGLRAVGLLLSLLSFLIMACNNHGDWRDFNKYEEYRYLVGIAILSALYTGGQTFRQIHQLYFAKDLPPLKHAVVVDFVGDQVMAYFLLSSASSAIPLTNRMREGADNVFTDSSAASISMSLLAFLALACTSVISGYKLSTQSFI